MVIVINELNLDRSNYRLIEYDVIESSEECVRVALERRVIQKKATVTESFRDASFLFDWLSPVVVVVLITTGPDAFMNDLYMTPIIWAFKQSN